MGRLIMWNVITLDGYFEGGNSWELPFHELVWGPELEQFSLEQLSQTSWLVFGRVTFEGMAAYWKTAQEGEVTGWMNSLPKIVCSTTLQTADWNNSRLIKEDVPNAIAELKASSDKDLFVFGSANLSRTFIQHNLFDEYRIGIAPVILGKGNPLFGPGLNRLDLNLISSRQLQNGGVILTYQHGK